MWAFYLLFIIVVMTEIAPISFGLKIPGSFH